MRTLRISLLISAIATIPYAALGQEEAAPTADDFVCALAGDCGDEAAATDSPSTDTPTTRRRPRIGEATRGFQLATPTPPSPPPASTNRRRNPATSTASNTTRRPTRPGTTQEAGRADLRLSFGANSSELSATAKTQVDAFAEALRRPQLANVRVRIEGHTDSSGGRAMNLGLSQRRAQAVADYLISRGIAANRLEVRGYGYDRPLSGRSAADNANRRVEAVRIS